ncbi:MAG: PIG-L family deacetylase [Gemmatimonadota bacterium]
MTPAPPRTEQEPGARGLGAFPGPVLVLAPHMDDETLACGRLLAALATAGRTIHILYATDGARSPRVREDDAQAVVRSRAREAHCAAAALGLSAHRLSFLALPDGSLARHTVSLTRGVGRLWDGVRPGSVLLPFRYDRHPDHLALHRAALACAGRAPGRPVLWEYFVYYRWRLVPGGDVRRCVREDVIHEPATLVFSEHKRRALECYRTQTTVWAPGQRRAIIPQSRVEEVSTAPELFAKMEAGGRSPLAPGVRSWVRVTHRLEPKLKQIKDTAADMAHGAVTMRRGRRSRRLAPADGAASEVPPPTRVVVFASPFPLPAEWLFLARVDAHPKLELTGVLCRGSGTGGRERMVDAWRRRGWLAPAVLLADYGRRYLQRAGPDRATRVRLRRRFRVAPNVHAPDVLRWAESLRPDIGVVYGGPILKPELFDIPTRGTLGVHHGQLPEYRGKKTIFWAMFNGEKSAGVTIQKINTGLDTGEVIREGAVRIRGRSYGAVSREVQALGVDLLLDAILAKGQTGSGTSRGSGGMLYRDPSAADIARFVVSRFRSR